MDILAASHRKPLAIVKMVEDNAPTYVHCRQGLDRTGVIAALVLRKRGMELNEALSYLTFARYHFPKKTLPSQISQESRFDLS